jgi:hypothetical protein
MCLKYCQVLRIFRRAFGLDTGTIDHLQIATITNCKSPTEPLTPNIIQSQSQSYITTDGQSASLSWNKAPIWGLRPDL